MCDNFLVQWHSLFLQTNRKRRLLNSPCIFVPNNMPEHYTQFFYRHSQPLNLALSLEFETADIFIMLIPNLFHGEQIKRDELLQVS